MKAFKVVIEMEVMAADHSLAAIVCKEKMNKSGVHNEFQVKEIGVDLEPQHITIIKR